MRLTVRVCAVFCVVALAHQLSGQEPAAPKSKPPIDSLKLPPGTVILVTPNPRDQNPNIDAVILTPDEYRKLLASAEQLKKLTTPDRPEAPSVCRLEIRRDADEDYIRVKAHFQFRTESARTIVALGLDHCRPVKATLEGGKLPALMAAPNGGFQLAADGVGEHGLTVDAIVPLSNSNSVNRGFNFSLPGSAITILEQLELPTDANRPRLNGQPMTTTIGPNSKIALGPARTLEVNWELAPAVKPGESMFTVESRIEARLDDRLFTTMGRLNVKVLRGTVSEFQLTAPATAKVTVAGAKPVTVEAPGEMRRTQWTLRRPPSADDLTIDVLMQQPATRRPLIVQGFPIARAAQLRGTLVMISPDTYRMVLTPRVDLIRDDSNASESPDRRESYEFVSIPANGGLAEVDPQQLKGELEVASAHSLRLVESGWRLSTKLELRPIRRDVDRLELEIPSELRDFRIVPLDAVEVVGVAKHTINGGQLIPVRLTEATRKPVTLTLEGTFDIAATTTASRLLLPHVVGAFDRGGSVSLLLPPGTEARGEVREWDHELISTWDHALAPNGDGVLATATDRAPARLDVTWRATGAEPPIRSTVDVEFEGRQAKLRQVFRIPSAPSQIQLHGPAELTGRVTLSEGGTLALAGPGNWVVRPIVAPGKECILSFESTVPMERLSPFVVPMLWPERLQRCENEVRVWAAPGPAGPRLPSVDNGPWKSIALPVIADRPRLPALAVRAAGIDVPLSLQFSEVGVDLPSAVIERTWIRAIVDDVGAVAIRTRFLIRPLREEPLSIRLPGPPILLRPAVRLNGRTIDVEVHNQQLLIPLTASTRAEHILDISCTLPARSGWNVKLESPRPVGPINFGAVRWQIHGPEGDVGFETSGILTPLVRWNWQRGLWSPTPSVSDAAMVRWFAGDLTNVAAEPFDTTLTATSARIDPVWMLFVPRAVVSVFASLTVLALGGWLVAIRWTPMRLVLSLIVLFGLLIVGWTWPQPAGELVALSQPGLVILIPAALLAAWIRRRADRRGVFAPLRLGPTPEHRRDGAPVERAAV